MTDTSWIYTPLDQFPIQSVDKIRYADTDRQGHVNNAVFSEFFETGRVELFYHPDAPLHDNQCSFVIASFHVDYRHEIHWPGTVRCGSAIAKLGTSSIRLVQVLYQDDVLVATCESVIVHVSEVTRKGTPLSESTRQRLAQAMYKE